MSSALRIGPSAMSLSSCMRDMVRWPGIWYTNVRWHALCDKGDVVRVGPNEVLQILQSWPSAVVSCADSNHVAPLRQPQNLPRHLQQEEPLGQGGASVQELQWGQIQLRLPHVRRSQESKGCAEPLILAGRDWGRRESVCREDESTLRGLRATKQGFQERRSVLCLPLHDHGHDNDLLLRQTNPCRRGAWLQGPDSGGHGCVAARLHPLQVFRSV